ncbi:MAG: hypothetical protein ACLGPL_04920 [Acidobacteriota bacterium]
MRIALCALDRDVLRTMKESLNDALASHRTVECSSVEELARSLADPLKPLDATVIAARGLDLDRFEAMEELLQDTSVLLVLLEGEERWLPRCHALRPRFLAYGESELPTIKEVLMRLLARRNSFVPHN